MSAEKSQLEDDAKERVTLLIRHRLPWLFLGLIGGIIATFISSTFETVLQKNIHLAFFIPIIVYLADAVGTQTETIYVRNLAKKQVKFHVYLFKELLLGLTVGALFGTIMGILSLLWFREPDIALTVGLAIFITITLAPIFALIVPALFQREHQDPAITAGPFTTIIQDILTLTIYFLIASVIIFR